MKFKNVISAILFILIVSSPLVCFASTTTTTTRSSSTTTTSTSTSTSTSTTTIPVYTVTPSAGSGGSISPSSAQTVNYGSTTSFTVTPNSGYAVSSVTGCSGTLSGSTYTTGAITGSCTVTASFAHITYTVTPSAGSGGSLSPSTAQTVNSGSTTSFTVTPNTGYNISSVTGCSGTLSGSTYTTGAITGSCTVTASFTPITYTVTPSAGTGGSLSPSTAQTVNSGSTTSFTVTPNSGYAVSSVTGCGGTLSGSTYTTGTITGNCTVTASFLHTYTVTPSAGSGGSISPSTAQTVNSGSTTSFTVTPNTGYSISSVTGCNGTLAGSTYTTGAITGSCTVTASFGQNGVCGSSNGQTFITQPSSNLCSVGSATTVAGSGPWTWKCNGLNGGTQASCSANVQTYTVTPAPGAGGSMSPSSTQTVAYNSTVSFSITPYGGYSILSVTGCGGILAGSSYTTGPITSNCTVTALFISSYTVSTSTSGGCNISPSRQTVNSGATTTFTVTAQFGNSISSVTGCGGTLSGSTYTTGPIGSNCTVTATCTYGTTTTTTTTTGSSSTTTTTTTTGTSTTTSVSVTGSSYCNVPSSLATVVPPNILFLIDVTGSMTQTLSTIAPTPATYSSTTTYQGYWVGTDNYSYSSSSGYWQQTSAAATSCPSSAGGISESSVYTGSCLNFWLMAKMDMVRWVLTGGSPASCNGSYQSSSCDVRLYTSSASTTTTPTTSVSTTTTTTRGGGIGGGTSGVSGVGTGVNSVCNSTGCIMQTVGGDQVLVPWAVINNGLINVFQTYTVQPRVGALFLHGESDVQAVDSHQVYVGDYPVGFGTTATAGVPQYDNIVTAINSIPPADDTPTGPAMWDVFNYFSQNSPQYGGFSPSSGSTDQWKNPMYECDGSGNNCVLTSCAKNFVILLTDGEWNTPSCTSTSPTVTPTINGTVSTQSYSEADPAQPAYVMHMGFTQNSTNVPANVSTSVTAVYTVGEYLGANGNNAVANVAMYGSFNTSGYTWPGNTSGFPATSCTVTVSTAGCSGTNTGSLCTPTPAISSDWDTTGASIAAGEGWPDTYINWTTDASDMYNAILSFVLDALKRASSGTAASVLTTSQGSGAILSQAVFYPERQFGLNEVSWTSELQTLWYYLDPLLANSAIIENDTTGVDQLNLSLDYVLQFSFDPATQQTVVNKYQYNNLTTPVASNVPIENISALWKAGSTLWARDPVANPRTIYTTTDLSTLTSFTGFNTSNAAIQSLLQVSSAADATNLINYIQGIDQSGYRNRTVTIGSSTGVWKLGDIVDSTPQIEASSPLNQYNLQPPQGYGDTSYGAFVSSLDYQTRNMVYASANDGMLHAFELGTLDTSAATGNTGNIKATLCNDTALQGNCLNETSSITNLGSEQWAFIPNNALPYLSYLGSPSYCHLYYVDGPLYVFDASINMLADCTAASYPGCKKQTTVNSSNNLTQNETSWRTVLIGSMGLGGACRYSGGSCNPVAGAPTGQGQCVLSPLSAGGLSSYFAFDVTTPTSPSLLWEFSSPSLGFSMSGPAVIRISYQNNGVPDNTKNGNWFAVFASGPTGPITNTQFLGRSDQDLMLFIVDVKTGSLLRTIDTGIPNAFATSVFNSPIDTDRWNPGSTGFYQDNVFYIGYVKQCPSTSPGCTDTTFTNGGVLRVMTNEDPNPNNWVVSKVIDDIGPVTTSVVKLQDTNNGNLWLYFGEGRFFYKTATGIDDANSQRNLYGIKEPCYNSSTNTMNNSCTSTVAFSSLTNRTTDNSTAAAPPTGWYINLAASSGTSLAERVITNPLASPNGIVYFTTFSPNSDLCAFGGNTFLWAVGYNTGTSGIDVTPTGSTTTQTKTVASVLQGKAMIQVSTGSIVQENLASTFASSRKSGAITGQPPEGQGLSVVVNPQPTKQILHIKER